MAMAGNNPTLYGYVFDTNLQINPFGLKKYVVYQAYELDVLPPKRNVQNTQNKYLKNNLLPKNIKKRKVQ